MKSIDEADYVIRIGQNAAENDELFRMADMEDNWFHLRNGPSAHVWLHMKNRELLKPQVMRELHKRCALLVKGHSRCPQGRTYVNHLKRRQLSRPPDSASGTVFMLKSPETVTC